MHGVYYGYTQLTILKIREKTKQTLSVSSGNAETAK